MMVETILILIGGLLGWMLLEFIFDDLPGMILKKLFGPTTEEEREYAERAAAEEREQTAKLVEEFQAYEASFAWLRDDVRVEKIRNRQKKYEFDVFLETAEGSFAVEKMLGPLSQCDAGNRRLCAEIAARLELETEQAWIATLTAALDLLREDRQRLEELLREIRPFVDLPRSLDSYHVGERFKHQAGLARARSRRGK